MDKERSYSPLTLIALILATCLCLAGAIGYRDQFAFVDDLRFKKTDMEMDLSGVSVTELEDLCNFPELERIDLRGTGISCADYDRVKEWFPAAEILWDIPFQGAYLDMNTKELALTALNREDLEAVSYFSALEKISAEECPDYVLLDALRREYPGLEVTYRVPVAGQLYSWDIGELTLKGQNPAELEEMIPYLPRLEKIHLIEPDGEGAALTALRDRFPEVNLTWQLEFKGLTVDSTVEKLDLTGIPTTVEEIESLIPYLPQLTYVDMTDCGISNEEMDALDQRHEDVKIVWTVTMGKWYRVKTDITTFIPIKDKYYPFGDDLYNLRYCHDIIALDIGHRQIKTCEWAAYMPHLKFLILADTPISDLTPLTGLEELVYLELFLSHVRDYSPLLTLTGLEDLNLCYTRGDPEIIAQMTWLKNCWWGYWEDVGVDYNEQKMLREALPDCNFCFVTKSSTGMGWRELPNYYAQRDAFGMYYMHG